MGAVLQLKCDWDVANLFVLAPGLKRWSYGSDEELSKAVSASCYLASRLQVNELYTVFVLPLGEKNVFRDF